MSDVIIVLSYHHYYHHYHHYNHYSHQSYLIFIIIILIAIMIVIACSHIMQILVGCSIVRDLIASNDFFVK